MNPLAINQPPVGKSEIYEGDLTGTDISFVPDHSHYSDVKIVGFEIVPRLKTDIDIAKRLLRERITGKSMSDFPYLEYNALTRGDFDCNDLQYKIGLANQCKKSVVWFLGESTGLTYVKKIECRKHWCPECGGKGGHIHKSRIHSALNRFDVDQYNFRQLVLTIPESLRDIMRDRNNIEKAEGYVKQLAEKFFGKPIFDKNGHVRKYKLEKGVISYVHLFGDQEVGVFKPHINLHILESISEKLVLSESILNSIRKYWLKKLQNFDETLTVVDVHYKFRIKKGHKLHAIKYMTRPWGVDDFQMCDDDLKSFLVMDMSGFQYLRFWGALANCNYKDDMNLQEETEKCQDKVGEKLTAVLISPFNHESWAKRMIEIDKDFYLIFEKGSRHERQEIETKEGLQ